MLLSELCNRAIQEVQILFADIIRKHREQVKGEVYKNGHRHTELIPPQMCALDVLIQTRPALS